MRHQRNVRRTERVRRAKYREYIVPLLAEGCVDCGNTDIRVLEFDHVRGVKVDNVTSMLKDASFERIQAELAKCEVRCRNCHVIVTYQRRGGSWHDSYRSVNAIPKLYNLGIQLRTVTHRDTLLSLLVSSNRLIRIAAQAAGSTTPSAQWRTLGILESDGAMRVGALAMASRVTQPGMTRLLTTMSDDGLVSRIPDPEDSRAWVIDITQHGRDELRGWRQVISETLEPRFHSLDDEEWAALELAATVLASRTAAEVSA